MNFDHIVLTEFEEGEGILVDLNSKKYYQLNETALLVWKAVEKGQTLEAIAEEIMTNYDVTPEHAKRSVGALLQDLKTYRLTDPTARWTDTRDIG